MDLNTNQFVENKSLISSSKDLYKMTDPIWMAENLKTDLALQMYLFKQKKITDMNVWKLKKLRLALNFPLDFDNPDTLHENVSKLLDKYGFAATKYILNKSNDFAQKNGKKLMVVLFDPYMLPELYLLMGPGMTKKL